MQLSSSSHHTIWCIKKERSRHLHSKTKMYKQVQYIATFLKTISRIVNIGWWGSVGRSGSADLSCATSLTHGNGSHSQSAAALSSFSILYGILLRSQYFLLCLFCYSSRYFNSSYIWESKCGTWYTKNNNSLPQKCGLVAVGRMTFSRARGRQFKEGGWILACLVRMPSPASRCYCQHLHT